MTSRPLVILHGWSDDGASFDRLARHLEEDPGAGAIHRISIGDYLTLSDELRFDDLQAALDRAWDERGLARTPGAVDVVVHSTGGLVIRDWLVRHFDPGTVPVKHLVMLAPANFGSSLAHVGRSILGRIAKGFIGSRQEGQGLLETGVGILRGLELASPYTWALAEQDRFGPWAEAYGPGGILCTVLAGNTGYRGIRGVVNEAGGDGVVRLSCAHLECARMVLDLMPGAAVPGEGTPSIVPRIVEQRVSGGRTAFCIQDRIDHGSIKLDAPPSRLSRAQRETLARIRRALTVEDDAFSAFCDECDRANQALTRGPDHPRAGPGYQNTVFRVRDDFGVPVTDYLVEFYHPDRRDGGALAGRIHQQALRDVHCYGADPSHRSLYLDTHRFLSLVQQDGGRLGFSLTAHPILGSGGAVAGFRTFADDEIQDLILKTEPLREWLVPHRTLLMDIRVHRQQLPSVFRLRGVQE